MKTEEIHLPAIVGRGYASFWKAKKRYRVLKGGRGSKKSVTTAIWFIYNIMKHPLANALVVRKTFNTHKDSTYAQLKWAAKRLQALGEWKFTSNPMEAVYLPTGQKILFRGFDDPLKLTSMTVETGVLCWVWLEEAYEIDDEADFDTLDESIRGEMPDGLWKQLTLTYNPWVNHHWTKKRFFDSADLNAFTLTTTYRCNEWLDDADREKIEALQFTNPDRYKVVGLGEYGLPGGTYFDEFTESIHVIEPFTIPDHWRRYTTLDYGRDMFAVLWIAVDTQNNAYCYKELYQSELIISAAASRYKEVNNNENIHIRYAPPDLWNARQETGKSAAELFRESGVMLHKSSNNRVQGWYNVKEWLKLINTRDEQTGAEIVTARLRIFKNCTNLIRTLPQLQRDEKDPNDVSNQPHELTHAPDALRGWCITRPVAAELPKEEDEDSRQNSYGNMVKAVTGGSIDRGFFNEGV